MKKVSMFSHTPGFRSWGREWTRQVEVVAVVPELDNNERTREGCDFVITEAEFARVRPLAEHPEFPLCIGDGDTPTAMKSETERLQRECDGMARTLDELRVQREAVEREIAGFEAQRDELQREVAELRDAAKAAEERALAAEHKLEEMAEHKLEAMAESATGKAAEDRATDLDDAPTEPAESTASEAEDAATGSGRRNRSRGNRRR